MEKTERLAFLLPLQIETRNLDEGKEEYRLVGYGAPFYREDDEGTEFELGPGMKERIMRGAFDNALKRPDDVRMLVNHDPSQPLGRTSMGTLALTIDERGLRFENDLPDTTLGNDTLVSVGRGDFAGASIGFMLPRGGDVIRKAGADEEEGVMIREIHDVRLLDVSVVTFPAYEATSVGVSRDAFEKFAEAEKLRDRAEFDKKLAKVKLDTMLASL